MPWFRTGPSPWTAEWGQKQTYKEAETQEAVSTRADRTSRRGAAFSSVGRDAAPPALCHGNICGGFTGQDGNAEPGELLASEKALVVWKLQNPALCQASVLAEANQRPKTGHRRGGGQEGFKAGLSNRSPMLLSLSDSSPGRLSEVSPEVSSSFSWRRLMVGPSHGGFC